MSKQHDPWDVVLDDEFVASATLHEVSAAERGACARQARKDIRASARRSRRAGRSRRLRAGRRVLPLVGLVAVALVVARWPGAGGDAVASAGPKSVRLLYAVPADVTIDEEMIPAIRHEIGIVQRWFEAQTAGRHLRIATENGLPSVEIRHLELTAADLRDRPDASALVGDELRPRPAAPTDPPPDEILLSFVPVAFPEQVRCGEASGSGYAIIWVGSCDLVPSLTSGSFGDGTTQVIAHEVAHVLGAVESCALHYGRNGHVVDDPTDLLYDGPVWSEPDTLTLDPGHDDYYRTDIAGCADIADHPVWTS